MAEVDKELDLTNCDENSVLITGAGASFPLPTADQIKRALVEAAFEFAGPKYGGLRTSVYSNISYSFVTLEALFTIFKYRLGDNFPADALIGACLDASYLGTADGQHHVANLIARSLNSDKPVFGKVITSNFDSLIESAQDELISKNPNIRYKTYNVVTSAQVIAHKERLDSLFDHGNKNTIIHIHGTIGDDINMVSHNKRMSVTDENKDIYIGKKTEGYSDPSTMFARGLARPFNEDMRLYIKSVLLEAKNVVAFGYRGADEYDFNLLLEEVLKESGDAFRKKVQWVSYAKDGSDLSEFVRTEFGGQIRKGEFAKELGHIVSPSMDPGMQLSIEDAFKQENGRRVGLIRSKLLSSWSSTGGSIKADVGDLLLDLSRNVLGAWTALEHYYLESMGFEQNKISAFGAGRTDRESVFCGVDFGEVVRGQRVYRFEQDNAHDDAAVISEGIGVVHTVSHKIFSELELSSEKSLDSRLCDRDVDAAMLKVCRAAAVDYQGLILRNRALKLRDIHIKRADIVLQLAKRSYEKFAECKYWAEEAALLVGSDPTFEVPREIDELVGWRRWRMIALDNMPRALEMIDPEKAMVAYQEIYEYRRNLLKNEQEKRQADSASANIPQLLLRISEALKLASNDYIRNKGGNRLMDGFSSFLNIASADAVDLIKENYEYSSMPNDRIISALEALSYFYLITGRSDDAVNQAKVAKEKFEGKMGYRRCGQYINNWRGNLDKEYRAQNFEPATSDMIKVLSSIN